GDDGDDVLLGGFGIDVINAGIGNDHVEAGDGDDVVQGGPGNDTILGGDGNNDLSGDDGDDTLTGGNDVDIIRGGAGNDVIQAIGGVGNHLFGDDGNDIIVGSSLGAETDPDFTDSTWFGDRIEGGAGDDQIDALGGADWIRAGSGNDRVSTGDGSDDVLGEDGDDWIYVGRTADARVSGGIGNDTIIGSHLGDDVIDGDDGDDDLIGQGGFDTRRGGIGNDRIDGGIGNDLIQGGDGEDELRGGGGNDEIEGGSGNDVIYGSDDAADVIRGGDGRDKVFGGGGNDQIDGDEGDDQLHGGPGDDVIRGGGGSDILTGDGDHDQLYGHNVGNLNDDNAVDYLYGDFGTNLVVQVGAGQDRLDAGGGNDFSFGESGDDFIATGSPGDLNDYGSGETAVPSDFVAPTPTANPSHSGATDQITFASTLPTATNAKGRWTGFSGSESGLGIGGHASGASQPAVVTDATGARYVAWVDGRSGRQEIYVARHTDAAGWESIGAGAEGGGVSNSAAASTQPTLALMVDGSVAVAWTEIAASGTSDIHVARFDSVANQWVDLPSGRSLSSTGMASDPTMISTVNGLVIAWLDQSSGIENVYLRRFDGSQWIELAGSASGSGVSGSSTEVSSVAVAADGNRIAVAWTQQLADQSQIYAKEFNGSTWLALGGSASAGGVSQSDARAEDPSVAYLSGNLFVAWSESDGPAELPGTQIRVAQFSGGSWTDQTTATFTGSDHAAREPQLASGGGGLFLAWVDQPNQGAIGVMKWNGTGFAESLWGDASPGIHPGSTGSSELNLFVDASGQPFVAWQGQAKGQTPQVFLRGDVSALVLPSRLFIADADAGTSVTSLLAGNDFGPGDTLLVVGEHVGNVTIEADDAGLTVIGAPGSRLLGNVTVNAENVTLQRVDVSGDLTIQANGATVLQSTLSDVSITGVSDAQLIESVASDVTITSAGNAVLESNQLRGIVLNLAGDAVIRFNEIGTGGIDNATASTGMISDNEIVGAGVGLWVRNLFGGQITRNVIRDGQTGVRYEAGAQLFGNTISGNATGIESGVAAEDAALGFVGQGIPNVIVGNTTGVLLNGLMRGQIIRANAIGVQGSGILGGDDLSHANEISENTIGVQFDGEVRYNRIGHNNLGVEAFTGQTIAHNVFFGNNGAVRVVDQDDVRIVGNTIYGTFGINVNLVSGKRAEVTGNVMSTETGTNIWVQPAAFEGFFSDYNVLHAGPSGVLVEYIAKFTDILDWQAGLGTFDLHSIGTTALDSNAALPSFHYPARDDFDVFPLVAGQAWTSPTIAAANPLIDLGRSATAADATDGAPTHDPVNLLANGSFENGLTGWTTSAGANVRAASPLPFEGDGYFHAGSVITGEVSQVIDLAASGTDLSQVD
ncbi:NosD domain-containing protein, partial [Stieleria sp.]|uniref:NosD domain-containing protein n=1 Tax=Stieleria sp. TaxID=2795976 RepID=UPI00356AF012